MGYYLPLKAALILIYLDMSDLFYHINAKVIEAFFMYYFSCDNHYTSLSEVTTAADNKLTQNKKEGKDQESIQSSTTPDWKVTTSQLDITNTRAKRSALSQQVTTRHQQTECA